MNKKIMIIAAVIIIVLAAGLWVNQQIAQREALKKVRVSVEGVNVKSIGLSSATLDIRFRLYNPTSVTATLDRAEYTLYGNDNYIGDGIIMQRVDIPPGEARTVTTEFNLIYTETARTVWSLLAEGNINWRIQGTAHFDTPFGTIDVPFDTGTGVR